MADDRDRRRIRTAPTGVRIQTAPPEDWPDSEVTPPLGHNATDADVIDAVNVIRQRAKRVSAIERKLERLDVKVEQRLDRLVTDLVEVLKSEHDLERTGKIAAIEDRKADHALRRDVIVRVVAGLAVAWGIVMTALSAHCQG